jgi:nitrite reductase/ring-hydroxylating ferredoxin subunit
MISNQWYAILESNEVKLGHPVAVKRMGERLVLRRNTHGEVTCMRDLCPHRGVALRRVRYWVTGSNVHFTAFSSIPLVAASLSRVVAEKHIRSIF